MFTETPLRPVLLWDDDEIGGRIYLQACHLSTGGLSKDEKGRFFEHAFSVLHKLTAIKYHCENYARIEAQQEREWEERFKAEPNASLREAFELIFEMEAFLFQVKSSLDMLVKLLVPILGKGVVKVHTYGSKGEDLERGLTAFKRHAGANVAAVDILIGLIQDDRDSWIQRTIDMRDRFSHYSALAGLRFEPAEWPSGWIQARKPTWDGAEIVPMLRTIYSNNVQFQQDFMSHALCLKLPGIQLVQENPDAMEKSWGSRAGRFVKWGLRFTPPGQ